MWITWIFCSVPFESRCCVEMHIRTYVRMDVRTYVRSTASNTPGYFPLYFFKEKKKEPYIHSSSCFRYYFPFFTSILKSCDSSFFQLEPRLPCHHFYINKLAAFCNHNLFLCLAFFVSLGIVCVCVRAQYHFVHIHRGGGDGDGATSAIATIHIWRSFWEKRCRVINSVKIFFTSTFT